MFAKFLGNNMQKKNFRIFFFERFRFFFTIRTDQNFIRRFSSRIRISNQRYIQENVCPQEGSASNHFQQLIRIFSFLAFTPAIF